jgi:hypothetical protein
MAHAAAGGPHLEGSFCYAICLFGCAALSLQAHWSTPPSIKYDPEYIFYLYQHNSYIKILNHLFASFELQMEKKSLFIL